MIILAEHVQLSDVYLTHDGEQTLLHVVVIQDDAVPVESISLTPYEANELISLLAQALLER